MAIFNSYVKLPEGIHATVGPTASLRCLQIRHQISGEIPTSRSAAENMELRGKKNGKWQHLSSPTSLVVL